MIVRNLGMVAALGLLAGAASAETAVYVLTDQLGSPVLETNAAAANIRAADYRAYGEELLSGPQTGPAFTGHYRDADTGLVYMQARYFDSLTGRFLSIDPEAVEHKSAKNFNRYSYAGDNPFKFTDPDGREIKLADRRDKARLEAAINSRAQGKFEFGRNGKLKMVDAGSPSEGRSAYYQSKLLEGIASKEKISIDIADSFTDSEGQSYDVDRDTNGGLTSGLAGMKIQVVVSGNPAPVRAASDGQEITADLGDIVAHELVGHAIPRATGNRDTGNAMRNENKVRQEAGRRTRMVNPNHGI